VNQTTTSFLTGLTLLSHSPLQSVVFSTGLNGVEQVASSATLKLLCFLCYGKQLHDKILCMMQIVNVCVLCEPVCGVCEREQVLLEHGLPACFWQLVMYVSWEHFCNCNLFAFHESSLGYNPMDIEIVIYI
jgi:hypothetical protein